MLEHGKNPAVAKWKTNIWKKDEILIIMLGDAHLKNASISFMVTNLFGKKRRCFRSCNLPVKLQQWPYVQKVMEKVTKPFRPMTKSHSTTWSHHPQFSNSEIYKKKSKSENLKKNAAEINEYSDFWFDHWSINKVLNRHHWQMTDKRSPTFVWKIYNRIGAARLFNNQR